MRARVAAFVANRWGLPAGRVRVSVRRLGGGLESTVSLATVRTGAPPDVPRRLIVKELREPSWREADVYAALRGHLPPPLLARVFGAESDGETRYLYLEAVRPVSRWPWPDIRVAAAVCRELARVHDALPRGMARAFAWDFEAELARSAEATLAAAHAARDAAGSRLWRRVGDLTRVVRTLPAIRSRVLATGRSVIHGDVHPGNVIMRAGPPRPAVALIDWARARIGSPLEDVASWLHSLGCWEPQARRRHDTLLRCYLESRATPRLLDGPLRTEYWLCSVTNGLAGAIRHHLAVLTEARSTAGASQASRRALAEWERVVRRGAALLRTSPGRCSGRAPAAARRPTQLPSP